MSPADDRSASPPFPPASEAQALQARLVSIETKLAFAEDTVEALNRTVFRQQQQLDLLQEAMRQLNGQLQAARSASGDPRHEVPPHY